MNTYKILIHTVVFFVLSTVLFSQEAVEIKEKRTANTKTFDNGNGSYTLEISLKKQHYKDDQGQYRAIQSDFVASRKKAWA
jgi:biopolymer transport protein ExbD